MAYTNSLSFDRNIQVVQNKTKFNNSKVFDKHKTVPNNKAKMAMISMLVVHPALKIDVLKMEHAFHTSYCEGDKVFYISPLNWKGHEEFQEQHVFLESTLDV